MEAPSVIIVGSMTPDVVHQVHMTPAADMEEAFSISAKDRQERSGGPDRAPWSPDVAYRDGSRNWDQAGLTGT